MQARDRRTDGQTDRQTECDAICGPLLKEEGRIIRQFIPRKFAEAANAHLVSTLLKRNVFSLSLKMSREISGERKLFHTAGP